MKSACEYLMAHKEPFERVGATVVKLDHSNKLLDLRRDRWIVDEF